MHRFNPYVLFSLGVFFIDQNWGKENKNNTHSTYGHNSTKTKRKKTATTKRKVKRKALYLFLFPMFSHVSLCTHKICVRGSVKWSRASNGCVCARTARNRKQTNGRGETITHTHKCTNMTYTQRILTWFACPNITNSRNNKYITIRSSRAHMHAHEQAIECSIIGKIERKKAQNTKHSDRETSSKNAHTNTHSPTNQPSNRPILVVPIWFCVCLLLFRSLWFMDSVIYVNLYVFSSLYASEWVFVFNFISIYAECLLHVREVILKLPIFSSLGAFFSSFVVVRSVEKRAYSKFKDNSIYVYLVYLLTYVVGTALIRIHGIQMWFIHFLQFGNTKRQ